MKNTTMNKKKAENKNRAFRIADNYWPRFTEYEIKENSEGRKFICPSPNARFRVYDPWLLQNEEGLERINDSSVAIQREDQPRYIHFLRYMEKMGIDFRQQYVMKLKLMANDFKQNSKTTKLLTNWFSENGLLGIFHHEIKMLRLPIERDYGPDDLFRSIIFFKRQGQMWAKESLYKQKKTWRNEPECSYLDWETGYVEIESYGVNSLFVDPEEEFQWSDPYWVKENFFPFSKDLSLILTSGNWERFWHEYCEPLDWVIYKMALLARGLDYLAAPPDTGSFFETGINKLNKLIGEFPAQYAYDYENQKVNIKFHSPSLLSSFALMALEDAGGGSRLFNCTRKNCGRIFASKHEKAKYCSDRCKSAHNSAMNRKRKKESSKEKIKTICKYCDGPIPNPRSNKGYCRKKCRDAARYQKKKKEKLKARLF